MAKKKENELTYLQMPLPQGGRPGTMTKLDWSGINYRNTKDTGEISKELNISTHFAPFLSPSEAKKCVMEIANSDLRKKGEKVVSNNRWFATNMGTSGEVVYHEKEDGLNIVSITVEIISDEKITGITYCNKGMIIISYYDTLEPKTGSKSGSVTTYSDFETVRNYRYSIHENNEKIEKITRGRSQCVSIPNGGSIEFQGFTDYADITNIGVFDALLMIPVGYSVQMDKRVVLERRFDNPEYWGTDNKMTTEGKIAFRDYVNESCGDQKSQYYFAYAEKLGERELSYYSDIEKNVKDFTVTSSEPWVYYYETPKGSTEKRTSENYQIKQEKRIEPFPKTSNVCVAHQRLFGIDEGRVFASGYNDYANWNLDTADSYSAENAWMSSTQSSDGGRNVGIIAYGGSVYVFKEESTLEIINTKNPFRMNEIFSVGAMDQKGIQVVGNYLIFVSHDGVKLYNGTSLRDIGYKLNIEKVNSAVTGTDGRKFYMSAEINDEGKKRLFVYDSLTGFWAEEDVGTETITVPGENEGDTFEITQQIEFVGFTKSDDGFYGLTTSGKVFRLDTKDYNHEWYIETDFFTNNSVDIKHIQKVQMLCDIAPGSELRAYILYDDEEFDPKTSHKIFERQNATDKEIKIPIRVIPRRTANYGFKIRIEGKGFSKLYQMEVGITGGGDKNITG